MARRPQHGLRRDATATFYGVATFQETEDVDAEENHGFQICPLFHPMKDEGSTATSLVRQRAVDGVEDAVEVFDEIGG